MHSSRRPGTPRSSARLLAAGLALVVAMSGCSKLGASDPDPSGTSASSAAPANGEPVADSTATALAAALTSGDLSRLGFVGDPATASKAAIADYATIMSGMDGIRPHVKAGAVAYRGSGVATVPLEHTFTLGAKPWTFTSTATLNLVQGVWHVAWRPEVVHPQLTAATRLRHTREVPARAPIIDRDGKAVVEERELYQVGLDKANLDRKKWATSAQKLATIMKVDVKAYQARVANSGAKAFVVASTVRKNELPAAALDVPGMATLTTKGSVGITKTFAQSLLGVVGTVDEQQAKASKNALEPGDLVGVTGLQKRYDAQLRGAVGHQIVMVERKNAPSPSPGEDPRVDTTLFDVKAVKGKPLQLTLSTTMQQKAEKVLAGVKPVASIVALNTRTGEVLAAANGPASQANPDATFGRYAPGSTFKVVTALALVRQGMSAQTMVNCPATTTVNGRVFKNYDDYPATKIGRITLAEALGHSCNTAFIEQAGKLPKGALADAAGSLGVGIDFDAGFPVFYGSVPDTSDPVVRAADAIGQGQIEASPLAMAAVAASVASGGTRVPWLVHGHTPTSTAEPLTTNEATQLQTMMKTTVSSGAGRSLAGVVTGAKTGTAEYGNAKPPRTHAWMIAYQGDVAVAVMVADGDSGSRTAGPLLKAFLG